MTETTAPKGAPSGTLTVHSANQNAAKMELALVQGDLSKLNDAERLGYFKQVCDSLGLNPLTKPFEFITLNGKLVLYARKDATEQLRKIHRISVKITRREVLEGVLVVEAEATLPEGRCDQSIGAVSLGGLKGEALANAFMKAETKAKRRVTLSISGLGLLDESEVIDIPPATPSRQVVLHEDDDAEARAAEAFERERASRPTPQPRSTHAGQHPRPSPSPSVTVSEGTSTEVSPAVMAAARRFGGATIAAVEGHPSEVLSSDHVADLIAEVVARVGGQHPLVLTWRKSPPSTVAHARGVIGVLGLELERSAGGGK